MDHANQGRAVGRRTALKALGATALAGVGIGAATPSAAAAEPRGGSRSTGDDVIVIGAGYAGVTAARELRAAGLRPIILEARDRIGGRIWTETYAGQSIELGGQWLSERHTRAFAELRRYGIGTVPGGLAPTRGFYPTTRGAQEFDLATAGPHGDGLLARLFQGSRHYFPHPEDPLRRRDLLSGVDLLSLRDGINALGLDAQDKLWLTGMTAVYSGGSNAFGGLTSMAQWWALAGWSTPGWHSLLDHRPVGGMGGVLDRMLVDADARLHLNSPVVSVTDHGGEVTVVTRSGAVHRAPSAVVAIPVNTWRTISFSPGLPLAHRRASAQTMGVPRATKLMIRIAGDLGDVTAIGTEGSTMSWVMPQARLDNGDLLLVGFSTDPTINPADVAGVQSRLRTILPGATVRGARGHQWESDPYALGGWGLRRPGQLIGLWPDVEQPHGRVAFATGDIASGWNGAFIDGAIESGYRAAAQALAIR
ncbi:flavin monoamine oxidase family protein [Saccharothrix sp. HUAS TT1]|uniref:flavin monoamine oxidase family protein n=1 Tax=unclassified Saccharothrix TaxID=2593673 RepID=UPI00345B8649